MKLEDLVAAGFTKDDAIKGADRYKELVNFMMKDNGVNALDASELILDLQYHKMTPKEWAIEKSARSEYEKEQEAIENEQLRGRER